MASRIAARHLTTILRTPRTISPSILRPYPRLTRTLQPTATRFAHTIPKPTIPAQDDASSSPDSTIPRKQLEPHYRLTFTCVPCTERSTHIVSKQGYHKGSVLITCPSCRNRHVISDNLNIFGDRKINVEELLREKGQLVKRGTLGEDGDIEFWEDTPIDSPEAAEASATSVEGGGEKDEARRLRETRDPSSRATDPTPPASILPSDSGTRPSVQGVSHQNPTPSTRRQYHRKGFYPPASLKTKANSPIRPPKSTSDSVTSNGNPVDDIYSLRMALRQEDDGINHKFRPPPYVKKLGYLSRTREPRDATSEGEPAPIIRKHISRTSDIQRGLRIGISSALDKRQDPSEDTSAREMKNEEREKGGKREKREKMEKKLSKATKKCPWTLGRHQPKKHEGKVWDSSVRKLPDRETTLEFEPGVVPCPGRRHGPWPGGKPPALDPPETPKGPRRRHGHV